MLLEKINKPSDIKTFTADELNTLAGEMRDALLFKLSRHGGHCGPNLGMVEATVFKSSFNRSALCFRLTC